MDAAEFAASRSGRLDDFDKELRPVVAKELPTKNFEEIVVGASVLWSEIFEQSSAKGATYHFILKRFQNQMRDVLARTKVDGSDAQITLVTKWIGTFAVNDAAYYGGRTMGHGTKTWHTRGDDSVRPTHRAVNGDTVDLGGSFTVDGTKMRYPGEPVGDPALWINCRCLLQTHEKDAMTADASDKTGDGAIVAALPAADHSVNQVSSEPQAHITLGYLGDIDPTELEAILQEVSLLASQCTPTLTDNVSGRGTLGAGGADVQLMNGDSTAALRGMLTQPDGGTMPHTAAAIEGADTYPTWIPHVTLGYPDAPAQGDPDYDTVPFDRLAVMQGDNQWEMPMGTTDVNRTGTAEQAAPVTADGQLSEFDDDPGPIPFHGVMAPIAKPSRDGRMFAPDAVYAGPGATLRYERTENHGSGTVAVGTITRMFQEDGFVKYEGYFASPDVRPEVNEVIQGLAEGWLSGTSVDLGEMEIGDVADSEFANEYPDVDYFTKAEIAALTVVGIGAFREAYLALGECDCPDSDEDAMVAAAFAEIAAFAEGAMPDGSFPIANKEDLRKAIQAHGRAKDIPAAKRHIISRAKALGASDMIPDEWDQSDVESFAPGTHDGPGWITDPKDTERIRNYWVSGEGARKINWGVPGDFNRCRKHLGKYVTNPNWLAGLCANMHKEAIKVWPGQEDGSRHARSLAASGDDEFAPAITASAAGPSTLPAAWFQNPELTGPTPLTITPEGRIYGHIATWGTCHIGIPGVCTTPPHSKSNYAYFRVGMVNTDEGEIPVGQITLGIGHASLAAKPRVAAAHYDNVNSAVADIATGEDVFGIWFSGAVRGHVDDEKILTLKAAKISGDWRDMGRGLEMIAALAVNVPGFPVPRTALAASGQHQDALVAAGILEDDEFELTEETSLAKKLGIVDAVVAEVTATFELRERARTAKASLESELRRLSLAEARKALS